jgi:hypothetical protein
MAFPMVKAKSKLETVGFPSGSVKGLLRFIKPDRILKELREISSARILFN